MSREEAIKIFNTVLFFGKCDCKKEEIEEALTMAIKALEEQQNPNSIRINFVGKEEAKEFDEYLKNQQEPILDKIRKEIVDLGQRTMNDNRASGIWACRDIIDKYKAESEG